MGFNCGIVGLPNVGKSTLFNRLVGRRLALVDDQPGVTRDRRFGDARLGDLRFQIVDTAGFEEGRAGSLQARMREQTEAAIEEADMVLMLTDARAGLLPEDEFFARLLRMPTNAAVRQSLDPVTLFCGEAAPEQRRQALGDVGCVIVPLLLLLI